MAKSVWVVTTIRRARYGGEITEQRVFSDEYGKSEYMKQAVLDMEKFKAWDDRVEKYGDWVFLRDSGGFVRRKIIAEEKVVE